MSNSARRSVSYATLHDFVQDADRLASGKHKTVGDWTFGQILDHLATAMNGSIDGFPFKGSWFARTFVAPFIKNSLLTKPMKPGFKLPKSADAYLPPNDANTTESLAKAKAAVERLGIEKPTVVHPLLGYLATEEWMALHIRHAELHMSFVVEDE